MSAADLKAWASFAWICVYAGGWFGFGAFVIFKVSACVVAR